MYCIVCPALMYLIVHLAHGTTCVSIQFIIERALLNVYEILVQDWKISQAT